MSTSKLYLSSPHMGGTEQKYVNEAFETNWVAPLALYLPQCYYFRYYCNFSGMILGSEARRPPPERCSRAGKLEG